MEAVAPLRNTLQYLDNSFAPFISSLSPVRALISSVLGVIRKIFLQTLITFFLSVNLWISNPALAFNIGSQMIFG